MFPVRSLISAAAYVHYPTNRASRTRTPISSFLRCALSTTPDKVSSGTSGSHLSTTKMKIVKATTKLKVGDNTINNLPDIPSVIQSSAFSGDSSTSALATSSLYKFTDRDERIAYLEDSIKNKDTTIMRLAEEISSATKRRDKLLDKEVLTTKETNRLRVIEEEDLPDMRKRKDRLAREILELKTELIALKNDKGGQVDTRIPVQDFAPPTLELFLQRLSEENGTSFPSKADPVEHILSPHYFGDLPCLGRYDLLAQFWIKCSKMSTTFGKTYATLGKTQPSNPMFIIQSSPGCGKTFILREIGRKNFKAIPNFVPNETLVKMKFVPISFNDRTSIQTEEKSLKYSENVAFILSFPRLVHSLFACDIDFKHFLRSFRRSYGIDYDPLRSHLDPTSAPSALPRHNLMDELRVLKRKYYKDKTFVALVDEISKVDYQLEISKEHKQLAETLRSLICSFCDFNTKNLFNFPIFTTLGMAFIENALRCETTSGRPVYSLGRLDMLSGADTEQLLLYFITEYNVNLLDDRGEQCATSLINRTAVVLNSVSGGHPRSIDLFFRGLVLIPFRSRSFKELLEDCIRDVDFVLTNQWCIQAAVVGTSVNFEDVVPYSNFTFTQAIERGDLIGSNEISDQYRPFVSEMMISKYLLVRTRIGVKTVELELLGRIMDIRRKFASEKFEQIIFWRERLLSLYRDKASPRIGRHNLFQSVKKIFSNGIQSFAANMSKNDNAFALEVDRSQELQIMYFQDIPELVSLKIDCGVLVPKDDYNPSFDFVIRYPVVNNNDAMQLPGASGLGSALAQEKDTQEFLEVFYQIKYSSNESTGTSPAKLNIPNIVKCREYCKTIACYPNRFVFVMLGWRETNDNVISSNLPENTVVYDKKSVSNEVGPTFSSFIDSHMLVDVIFTKK